MLRRLGSLAGSTVLAVVAIVYVFAADARSASDAYHPLDTHLEATYVGTLEAILERRYLRVLTSRNAFDYFLHEGEDRGFQYEMVKAFVDRLNERFPDPKAPPIQFQMLPVSSDQLIPTLVAGSGDMIAARLTVTPERQHSVAFSKPYDQVDEVLITHLRPQDFASLEDLGGHRVAVRRSSSYYTSLRGLNERLTQRGLRPVEIVPIDDALETDAILELVSLKKFDFTVADSQLGIMAAEVFDGLYMLQDLYLRRAGKIAWAAHPAARDLVTEINAFLPKYKKGTLLGNVAYKRYFRDFGGIRDRFREGTPKTLSPYDDALRKYAERYGFDWRLMAAVAYQESRFRQNIKNRWGAIGLFQIKASTAKEPYIAIPEIEGEKNAANNVHAGIKYLAWIKDRYFDPIEEMEERDRVRMALASYNAGPAAVRRARNKAKKMGLDPNRWFRNVELAMLAQKRVEPVNYVSEVNQRYLSYILLGIDGPAAAAPAPPDSGRKKARNK